MSEDLSGGEDYGQTKRHYFLNDFVGIPLMTATLDWYPIGSRAFLSNPQLFDLTKGWSLHRHNQPAQPIFFGFLPWPDPSPSFEAKRIQVRCNTTSFIRFGGALNVAHEVPPKVTTIFFQRVFNVFVRSAATAATMKISFEG
jgi:hypothetical protein